MTAPKVDDYAWLFGTAENDNNSWLRKSQVRPDDLQGSTSKIDDPLEVSFHEDNNWLRPSQTDGDIPTQMLSPYHVSSQDAFGTPINEDSSWLTPSAGDEKIPAGMLDEYDVTSQDIFGTPINVDFSQTAAVEVPLLSTPINFEYEELLDHKVRSVYLVTYSQADTSRFDRQSFAEAVITLFNRGKAKVLNWVCAMENHRDGGHHFHLAVHLSKIKRWKGVKNDMIKEHNVVLHFSDLHNDYSDAWHYVTKEDKNCIQSLNHPEIVRMTAPRTRRATAQRKAGGRINQKGKEKVKRLTPLAFTQIIRKEKIKRLIELYSCMKKSEREGNFALSEFFHNRKKSKVEELIATTWEIERADEDLQREKLTRLEILAKYMDDHSCECHGQWLRLALATLSNNNISQNDFASAVILLLDEGRKKGSNIVIKGEADCGKSFLFFPLKNIFRCFSNPASSTFNWIGVENAEVIFLNDFRWEPAVIPWFQLLQLLEGDEVNFPAPKNHSEANITFTRDSPIFATSGDEIVSNKIGSLMMKETKMMKKRWKVFSFTYEIPHHEIQEVKPCGVCFAKLITDPEHLFQ